MGPSVSPGDEPHARPAHLSRGPQDDVAFAIRVEQGGRTLRLFLTGEFDWACIERVFTLTRASKQLTLVDQVSTADERN